MAQRAYRNILRSYEKFYLRQTRHNTKQYLKNSALNGMRSSAVKKHEGQISNFSFQISTFRERLIPMRPENQFSADTYEILFRSLMQTSGDCILLIDRALKIIEINQPTCTTFKMPFEKILNTDFQNLLEPQDRHTLQEICQGMGANASWKGRMNGLDGSDDVFPIQLTIKRMGPDGQIYCFVIARDLREYTALKESLSQEKAQRREMYITLRNVMNSIEKEKTGQDKLIAHKIETLIFPALDKVRKEPSKDMQNSYLDFIRDQLLGLTKTFPRELDIGFIRLTRSEMKICHYLQAGYSSKEIADILNISIETIQTHRKNIRKKLGLHGRKISLYSFLSTRRKIGVIA
jgi:hypothetical protein